MGESRMLALVALFAALAGCGPMAEPPSDVGADAGSDASALDVGSDAHDAAAASDGGLDAFAVTDAGPQLVLSPTPYDFGIAGSCSGFPTHTFTLTSVAGTTPTSVALSGLDAAEYAIDRDGCTGVALAPGGSCTIDVTYRPRTAGDHAAALDVSAGAGASAHAALTGMGAFPPALMLVPASRNFGSLVVPSTSGNVDFTLRNVCPVAVTLTSMVTGADASRFSIVASTCDGAPLAGGGTCTLTIVFSPDRMGAFSAMLEVAGETPSGSAVSASSSLTGTGLAPPSPAISPATHDFGHVPLACGGSAPQRFTLTSTGATSIDVTAVTLAGTNPSDFVVASDTCTGAMLAPGATCTIGIRFVPSAIGARDATLSVTANGSAPGTASLSGVGSGSAGVVLTPALHDYGTVAVGTSMGADFTVTSACPAPIGPLASAITGVSAGRFPILSSTCEGVMLPGGGTCTVTVAFAPITAGAVTAVLSVSGAVGGMDSSDLSGTGG